MMTKKKEDNNEELEKIKLENIELNDKVLRSLAELQNYKKRKDEELNRMLKYSDEDLILELLPIIDNFERAIKLDDTNLTDELSKFLEGFKMIYSSIVNLLNKYEVKEIESLNKTFDPTYHQAVLTDDLEGYENNIVIEVLQKGYIYKDKVIRPTMVKVNIKKGEMKNE
ncbi:MAG: nucleotide exchange factor GrpE [Tenericutes bacterium]|nr:nucleotide exchange factor GrpE [Bacilli bacterium]MDD4831583.1 nucleotide exchange factor GrpE [Bacilli bacterium]NLV89858.1 nucleotide exchange factor GrpE [Mycoplasmatota bacterium]